MAVDRRDASRIIPAIIFSNGTSVLRHVQSALSIVAFLALSVAPTSGFSNESLPDPVQRVLERFNYDGSGLSISIRRLSDGEDILAFNADKSRNPASTVKLITTMAALDLLGPAHRWETHLRIPEGAEEQTPDNIYFVGGGDPYLVEERMYQFAKSLWREGVRTIAGDLIMDDTYYQVAREDTGAFDDQPFRIYNVLPSAVLSNFNRTRFEFKPERRGVAVSADPALPSLNVENRLTLAAGRCAGYRRGINLELSRDGSAQFSGRFPSGCKSYAFGRSVMPSWRYTGELFVKLWRQVGGEFLGEIRRGKAPDPAQSLVRFESLSLTEIIRLINKHSSNVMTRHLVYEIAAANGAEPATEAAGIEGIRLWLAMRGLDFADMPLENGAGKSRRTRLATENLVDLLAIAHGHRFAPEFIASLPILGLDGTLDDRMDATNMAGWGHLKTGSLDHVAAIAGYVTDRRGETYLVAIIHNARETHRGAGEALHHAVLGWLGSQFEALSVPMTRHERPIDVK